MSNAVNLIFDGEFIQAATVAAHWGVPDAPDVYRFTAGNATSAIKRSESFPGAFRNSNPTCWGWQSDGGLEHISARRPCPGDRSNLDLTPSQADRRIYGVATAEPSGAETGNATASIVRPLT